MRFSSVPRGEPLATGKATNACSRKVHVVRQEVEKSTDTVWAPPRAIEQTRVFGDPLKMLAKIQAKISQTGSESTVPAEKVAQEMDEQTSADCAAVPRSIERQKAQM